MYKRFIILILLLFFAISPIFAVDYPNPAGYVNDFANLYSSDFKAKLEQNLSNFEKETTVEIAVATVKSLEGLDIETYVVELFEKWKIGKKGEDNGLLLLIAKEDRKIRIEVGYGLEPYITDGRAGDIIRNQISPEFKKENYEAGTLAAVEKLEKYISDKDIAPKESKQTDEGALWIVIGFLFLFYIVATYLASFLGRTKEIWPGGLIGGIVGIIIGIVIGSIFISALIGVFGGLFGLILDAILSKNYKVRKEKGLPTGFFHTWGGFSGGGGSGGGGFGGGSSGGGGASGGW